MATKKNETIILDTPGQIQAYVFTSNMYRLAMEIVGWKWKSPMLQVLFDIGWTDKRYKSTKKNRQAVLRAMLEKRTEIYGQMPISSTIQKGLDA